MEFPISNSSMITILVALYWQRWRIEDAYSIVKRLLGLAYFWSGAQNAVELRIWATWLLYVVLVDLTDAVAETLNQPFAVISIEMVYRSLYFFTQAHHHGRAEDVVTYLTANAKLLGPLIDCLSDLHPKWIVRSYLRTDAESLGHIYSKG